MASNPTQERENVQAEVVRPSELGAADLNRWRAMRSAATHLRSPFLAPEYALAVSRIRPEARVAVLTEGHTTVGYFCFELCHGAARPLGYSLSDVEAIVHDAAWTVRPREILQACRLAGWDFETLIEEQSIDGIRPARLQPSPIMDISRGYDTYIKERVAQSKKIVQATGRQQRKLERELGEIRFVLDDTDQQSLQVLMGWKSGQYREMGVWDRFSDPSIVALAHDLFRTKDPECSGLLSTLYVADKPVAAHFGLASSTSLAAWFPAYNPALSRFSPGVLLHFMMAEAAARHGIGEINLGRGHHEYKERLKTGDVMVAKGAVHAAGIAPRVLARRMARAPREYVRPWLRRHPRWEGAAMSGVNSLRGLR